MGRNNSANMSSRTGPEAEVAASDGAAVAATGADEGTSTGGTAAATTSGAVIASTGTGWCTGGAPSWAADDDGTGPTDGAEFTSAKALIAAVALSMAGLSEAGAETAGVDGTASDLSTGSLARTDVSADGRFAGAIGTSVASGARADAAGCALNERAFTDDGTGWDFATAAPAGAFRRSRIACIDAGASGDFASGSLAMVGAIMGAETLACATACGSCEDCCTGGAPIIAEIASSFGVPD